MASQVRQELRRQGVTQDEVAQYLQVQRVTINRMLSQRSAVGPLPLWDKIAAGLGGRWVVTFERDETREN